MPFRVLLADDSDIALLGMKQVLAAATDITITTCCQTLQEVLHVLQLNPPQVAVINEQLALEVSVIELIQQMKQVAPRTRLILVGSFSNGCLIHDLFACGVRGYLYRCDRLAECLPYAIRMVMRERPYLSPTATADYLVTLEQPTRKWELDTEAYSVLRLLAEGNSVGSIAAHLKVPQRRVYWVREKLRRRFGAVTNEHLISRAAAEGFANFLG